MSEPDRTQAGGETRQPRLADVLIEPADTLATTFDIDEYLHVLCVRTHHLFAVDAVGVMLEGPDGNLG